MALGKGSGGEPTLGNHNPYPKRNPIFALSRLHLLLVILKLSLAPNNTMPSQPNPQPIVRLPSLRRRALLLINRHSRRGDRAYWAAIQELEQWGLEVVQVEAKHTDEFASLIRQQADSVDLVVVGGGDGTLNAAVEGIVETGLPLGILPLGTANDLARTLGLPLTVPEACQAIATGYLKPIDLGWVNGKHFFNVASIGLSVDITQNLTKDAKKRWGVLAYAKTALKAISQLKRFRAEIRCNGKAVGVKTVQIAIGNGRFYGGGMAIAHDAAIDDQRLDLYSLEVRHTWHLLFVLPALWKGHHRKLGVRTLESQTIEIRTKKPYPINTDGEITTQTPAVFKLVPHAIQVIVPRPIAVTGLPPAL